VRDDVISSTLQLISESTSHQSYVTLQLFKAVSEDLQDRQPLTQVAVWAIGLYFVCFLIKKYFLLVILI